MNQHSDDRYLEKFQDIPCVSCFDTSGNMGLSETRLITLKFMVDHNSQHVSPKNSWRAHPTSFSLPGRE